MRRVHWFRCNTKFHDMNVAVPAADERAIEVLASGLPLFHCTVRSALTVHGLPCVGAATTDGVVNVPRGVRFGGWNHPLQPLFQSPLTVFNQPSSTLCNPFHPFPTPFPSSTLFDSCQPLIPSSFSSLSSLFLPPFEHPSLRG